MNLEIIQRNFEIDVKRMQRKIGSILRRLKEKRLTEHKQHCLMRRLKKYDRWIQTESGRLEQFAKDALST